MKYGESVQQNRAQGRMFFSAVGTLWMMAWCLKKPAQDLSTLLLILLSGAVLFLWALCDFRASHTVRHGSHSLAARVYAEPQLGLCWAHVMEGMLCAAGMLFSLVFLLTLIGHPGWLVAVLILLAGLSCLPLGLILQSRIHYLAGIALIAVALIYPWLGMVRAPQEACFVAGIILWVSALHGFFVDHYYASRPPAASRRALMLVY